MVCVLNKGFAGAETGAFEQGYLFPFLIGNGNEVQACAASVVQLFGFRRQYIAGVGALCARSAVMGAFLNVKINAGGLKDRTFADAMLVSGAEIEQKAIQMETDIMGIVKGKIGF